MMEECHRFLLLFKTSCGTSVLFGATDQKRDLFVCILPLIWLFLRSSLKEPTCWINVEAETKSSASIECLNASFSISVPMNSFKRSWGSLNSFLGFWFEMIWWIKVISWKLKRKSYWNQLLKVETHFFRRL